MTNIVKSIVAGRTCSGHWSMSSTDFTLPWLLKKFGEHAFSDTGLSAYVWERTFSPTLHGIHCLICAQWQTQQ